MIGLGDESRPVLVFRPVAALADEFLVGEAFGDDHMRHRRQDRDIGAWLQRQVIGGFDMRRAHDVGAPGIDDDQFGALAQPLLQS
ncbi:hypothetical protein D9M72_456650 [compost metagenome]